MAIFLTQPHIVEMLGVYAQFLWNTGTPYLCPAAKGFTADIYIHRVLILMLEFVQTFDC